MNTVNAALLINMLGFTVGAALYAMLGAMVLYHNRASPTTANRLLLTTSGLGLVWNLGELFVYIQADLGGTGELRYVSAAAYSTLGFLPSVVVHAAQSGGQGSRVLTFAAYGLSCFAAALHFHAAFTGGVSPSRLALMAMTVGALLLAAGLLVSNIRQTLENKAIWLAAMLVFAVSALHLSGDGEGSSWIIELAAHQSSLPLALTILHQTYKFAFADLFLKRAISLMLLALVAFSLYVLVAAPLLRYHETHDRNDALAISLILTLWITTALIYPTLHKSAVWLVDTVMLRRTNYRVLQVGLNREIEDQETAEAVLDLVRLRLGDALTADMTEVVRSDELGARQPDEIVEFVEGAASLLIPTVDPPFYKIVLSQLQGGRRLLSEETVMLASVATAAGRRIDALRISVERWEREFREQEFSRLATEAQLTALRSQINPHFLFNALTTIGYLIQTSPDKAFSTLLHLTKLLRSVLGKAEEFSSLRDELTLIGSYLDIERTRFDDRLRVEIDVPKELMQVRIPSLVLQPLVENAIKHGVSENKDGCVVKIKAESGSKTLILKVIDTGTGNAANSNRASTGTGLDNIRQRLKSYYGDAAQMTLTIGTAEGTVARVDIPYKIPAGGSKPSAAVKVIK